MKVNVFVPSHITGFFNICHNENPYINGSEGCGILLDKGVKTTIKKTNKENSIIINGKIDHDHDLIILNTIDLIKKQYNIEGNFKIKQNIEVPIGSGFGTSASSALGTSIGLKELFNLEMSIIEAGQIAHLGEISLSTGLGDVIAEMSKGIVLRVKPGAPGYGKTEYDEEDLYVISKTLGEIDTSSIINDPLHKEKINEFGLAMKEKYQKNRTYKNFIECSFEFSKKTQLLSSELLKIINDFNEFTIGASMAMLGNTAFGLSENKVDLNDNNTFISKIDNTGIKINNKAIL